MAEFDGMPQATESNAQVQAVVGAVQIAQASTQSEVQLPGAGQRIVVHVTPGQHIVIPGLDFSTATVTQEAAGLLITLPDGGQIFLEGFVQAAGGGNPPVIEIPGLAEIPAADILAAVTGAPGDIQPAAGPAAGTGATPVGGGDAAHGGGAGFGAFSAADFGPGLNTVDLLPKLPFARPVPDPVPSSFPNETLTEQLAAPVVTVSINDAPAVLECCIDERGGEQGPEIIQLLSATPGQGGNALIDGLGGPAGFGTGVLGANDDGSTGFINITSVFPTGMNFFGTVYQGFYINNNGNITFNSSLGTYTPFALTGATGNPIIAPFFADVDTRGSAGNVSPGGTSTGTNLVYYSLDAVNGQITITWNDVGYYGSHSDLVNAFQLVIYSTGGDNFAFEFRYENVDWTTGDASGGSGGLGGVVARAGWNSGNGTDFYELPQSGDQTQILNLETTSNPGTAQDGNWVFNVVGGQVVTDTDCVADFTVTLSSVATSDVVIHYHTVDGTAVAGQDYVGVIDGTITILAGDTVGHILVPLLGDDVVEGTENFSVVLDSASNAVITDDTGIGTILDNDVIVGVTTTAFDGETGTGCVLEGQVAKFTLALEGGDGNVVNVDMNLASGTATAGADFDNLSIWNADHTVQLASVDGSGNFTLHVDTAQASTFDFFVFANDDTLVEDMEDFTVTILGGSVEGGSSDCEFIIDEGAGSATACIDDVSAVTFAIQVDDNGAESLGQLVGISEEDVTDNTATFTITQGGDTLTGASTASVTVTMSGTAADADFTSAVISAIATAANVAGIDVSGQDATSLTLTWSAGDPSSFNVDLTAFNDQLVEGGETLTLTLSGETVSSGSASLVSGQEAAAATITDLDSDVTFAVTVTSEGAGNDTPTQSATVGEENGSDNQGTFTISKGGDALTGSNTASVIVTIGGTTENGAGGIGASQDFTASVVSAMQAGATAANVGFVDNLDGTVTLTWSAASTSNDVLVDLTAADDALTDSPETLSLSLSGETVDNGSASLVGGQTSADLTITDVDAAVTFAVTVTSEATGNDTPNGLAVIAEENGSDDQGMFTIAKGGDALTGSNTASVVITVSGTGEDGDFTLIDGTPADYSAIVATIAGAANAALGAGSAVISGDTVTVTWGAGDPAEFNVFLTALNDDLLDSPENIVLTLSAPTVAGGSATLVAGDESAQLNITDNDVAVTFAVTVASESVGNDTPNGLAVIAEENGSDDQGTFTVTLGGGALTGANTASVVITVSGTGEDGDFTLADGTPADYSAIVAAVAAAANTALGAGSAVIAGDTVTVTWGAGDPASFNVDLTAFNDDLLDSPENIVLTLTTPLVAEGSATLVAGDESAQLNITDNDAAVTFAVTVTSEAAGNDTPNGLAVIGEENTSDDVGTFTVALGGGALTGANTASVVITVSGTGEDGDFTLADGTPLDQSAIVAAVAAAANTALGAGSAVIAGDTVTVTWGAGDPASFNVNLTAFNDALLDSPENIVLTLTTPLVTEGTAALVAGDESAQLNVTDTDVPPPNILDGTMITNSNVTLQLVTLTWQEVNDPTHAAAKIYDLSLQGQQGSILQDVGFAIDDAKQYLVGLEASAGTKGIVTDFSLEGVTIQGAGNAQLELNDTSATNSDSTAITAVINPQDPIVQAKTLSTDGDANVNTITDAGAGTVNYLYGASGNDTLNGSSDSDMLNGGPGLDHINGNGGNDLIVYDAASNDIIDGGTGIDTVRIDLGAITLSLAGSGTQTSGAGDTMGPAQNVFVDLTGKAISNVEIFLITEEAGTSSLAVDPNDNVGTTIRLNAADVINYSPTDSLTILGSPGDILQLNQSSAWVASAPVVDAQNQTTVTWNTTIGPAATVVVDAQVTVQQVV